jgi:hypothetical protein
MASDSDALSFGVTVLCTVRPGALLLSTIFGKIAARQCPGFRSYATIEYSEMWAMGRLLRDHAPATRRCQRLRDRPSPRQLRPYRQIAEGANHLTVERNGHGRYTQGRGASRGLRQCLPEICERMAWFGRAGCAVRLTALMARSASSIR